MSDNHKESHGDVRDLFSELKSWMKQSDNCKVPQSEVRDLFSELNSWMEESQRKFSTIINSHSNSITKGVNDLVEGNANLQAELFAIKNELGKMLERT